MHDMHPLQIVALAVLGFFILGLLSVGAMAFVLVFFGDKITYKANSRLITWPRAIGRWLDSAANFLRCALDALAALSSGRRAKEAVDEIVSGQPRLPL